MSSSTDVVSDGPESESSFQFFAELPYELRLHCLGFLKAGDLARVALVSREFSEVVKFGRSLWERFLLLDPRSPPPPSRVCHASFVYNGRLLIFGGHLPQFTGEADKIAQPKNDMWQYDLTSHAWTEITIAERLPKITETMAVVWNDKLYYYAGFGGNRSCDINEFNLSTGAHRVIPAVGAYCPKQGTSAHSTVLYDDALYVYGGWDGYKSCNLLFKFDLKADRWVPVVSNGVAPYSRSHLAVVYDDNMYIWGGVGHAQFNTKMCKYSFVTGVWSEVAMKGDVPSARSRIKGVVHDHLLYMLGGWNRGILMNEVYSFNFQTSTWNLRSVRFPTPLAQYSMNILQPAVGGPLVLVFGGFNGETPTSTLYAMKLLG